LLVASFLFFLLWKLGGIVYIHIARLGDTLPLPLPLALHSHLLTITNHPHTQGNLQAAAGPSSSFAHTNHHRLSQRHTQRL